MPTGWFQSAREFLRIRQSEYEGAVSWALFVENEYWNTAAQKGITDTATGRAKYRDYEQKFWSGPKGDPSQSGKLEPRKPPYRTDILNTRVWDGVAHSIVEKSAISSLPLVTNFNIGVGSAFAIEGRRAGRRPWNNAGIADPSLTWQYWTEESGHATSAVALDETTAWDGGHSLKLTGTARHRDSVTLHLFKTEVRLHRESEVSIKVSGTSGRIELGLTFRDDPESPEWIPLHGRPSGAWRTVSARLHHQRGRTVAKISLRIHGDHRGTIDMNIGQFKAVDPSAARRPEPPRRFRIDRVDTTRHTTSAYLSWELGRRCWAYDLFAVHGRSRIWIGRVHRNVYYAHDLPIDAGRLSVEIVPIAQDGTRGRGVLAHRTLSET